MTRSKEKVEEQFDAIITDISESGKSIFASLKGKMSSRSFYDILEKEPEKIQRYARACEMRADLIAEEAMQISDGEGDDVMILPDGREVENQRVIARDRLKVETRKWFLSKLHPKKYGEKISQEVNGADGKDFTINVRITDA